MLSEKVKYALEEKESFAVTPEGHCKFFCWYRIRVFIVKFITQNKLKMQVVFWYIILYIHFLIDGRSFHASSSEVSENSAC